MTRWACSAFGCSVWTCGTEALQIYARRLTRTATEHLTRKGELVCVARSLGSIVDHLHVLQGLWGALLTTYMCCMALHVWLCMQTARHIILHNM